jgi:hypothetical protein
MRTAAGENSWQYYGDRLLQEYSRRLLSRDKTQFAVQRAGGGCRFEAPIIS